MSSIDLQQRSLLDSGCKGLQVSLSESQLEQQLQFLQLLLRWNKVYNLTAIRDPLQMVSHHLVDSLAITPYIYGKTVLDVGCGGGLPGIPLAIALPDVQFTLLDSNGKKTRFVQQAQIELGLKNLVVVQNRIENYASEQSQDYPASQQFDTVTSRAFAALGDFYQQILPLCHKDTHILAMKGKKPESEMAQVPAESIVATKALKVPNVDGDRHLIHLKKIN